MKAKEFSRVTALVDVEIEDKLKSLTGARNRRILINKAYEFALANVEDFSLTLSLADLYTLEEIKELSKDARITVRGEGE